MISNSLSIDPIYGRFSQSLTRHTHTPPVLPSPRALPRRARLSQPEVSRPVLRASVFQKIRYLTDLILILSEPIDSLTVCPDRPCTGPVFCSFLIKSRSSLHSSRYSKENGHIRVFRAGCPRLRVLAWGVVRGAPHSRRTAHLTASRPPSAPWSMAVSSSTPKGAPRGNFSILLRAASCRRRPSRARLAGSAAANSPARRVAREFITNDEPAPRGR